MSCFKKHWLLLCNAQSLLYKLDELRALIAANNPYVVCVSETWFSPMINNDLICLSGYCSFRNDRRDNPLDDRRGGGTIVYISVSMSPFNVELPDELNKPRGIECNLVGFYDPCLSYILCVYVPPGLHAHTFHDFQEYVTNAFDFLLSRAPDAKLYLCGDLNQYDFSFLTTAFHLYNVVDFQTFRDNTLDKFFCSKNVFNEFRSICAPPLGFAVHSHNVVFISKNASCVSDSHLLHKVFDLRKSNIDAFVSSIEYVDWSPIFTHSCVSDSLTYFYEQFYKAMSVIPVSFVKIKPQTKPWITPVVLDLINKRWRAYREKHFSLYAHYKDKVKKEIFKSKRLWSNRMCKTPRGLWSFVNDVRGLKTSKSMNQIVSLFSDVRAT